MEVTLWGTRGSLATPGPDTARYGGNTSCVAVRGREVHRRRRARVALLVEEAEDGEVAMAGGHVHGRGRDHV